MSRGSNLSNMKGFLVLVFAAVVLVCGYHFATSSSSATTRAATTTGILEAVPSLFAPLPQQEKLPSLVGETSSPDYDLWNSDYNVVHVINSRFMQHQANLNALGAARFDLFETFTFPSMEQQTNQQYMWLIWTDKDLSGVLLEKLIKKVSQMPNTLLLGGEMPKDAGNLRTLYSHSWEELSDSIIVGDAKLLMDYYKASKTHLLLESRLDADDALQKTFVDSIQAQASQSLGRERGSPGKIRQFCPESHIEWRYFHEHVEEQDSLGHLIQYHDKNFCIQTGWTSAYHLEDETVQDSRKLHLVNCEEHELPHCPEGVLPDCEAYDVSEPALDADFNNGGDACPYAGVPNPAKRCMYNGENEVVPDFAVNSELVNGNTFQCTVDGTSDIITLEVSNVQTKTEDNEVEITGATLTVVGGDYHMSAVAVKAQSVHVYYFGETPNPNDASFEKGVLGGITGHFETIGNKGVSHITMCVVPDDFCDPDECVEEGRLLQTGENAMVEDEETESSMTYFDASVLLSRTPTAAGMKNVLPGTKGGGLRSIALDTLEPAQAQEDAWTITKDAFGVSKDDVAHLKKRFEENMESILIDAFVGQCTPGHSCKDSTKRVLGYLLENIYQARAEN